MSDPSKPPVSNQNFAMMPSQMPPLNSVDRMSELQDFPIGLSNQTFQVPYGTPTNIFMYQDNQFATRGSTYIKEEKNDVCSSAAMYSDSPFSTRGSVYIKEEKDDVCNSSSALHSRPVSAPESGASPKTFGAFSPGSDQEKPDKLGVFADLVLGLDKGMSPLSVGNVSVQDRNHPSPAGSSASHQDVLRYQRDAMLSAINYTDSVFDVNVGSLSGLDEGLIGNLGVSTSGAGNNSCLDLFDGDTGQDTYMENNQDLQLSPQTFSNNPDAFNENSNLSSIAENNADNAGNNEEVKSSDLNQLSIDKARLKGKPTKSTSPNRQGVQTCFQCGKVFSNSSALAKHKLTHSDERKYVCQLCSKAFKRQDHLNGHMLTHRKKKPYECKVDGCGKSYCDARSLRRHTENHHSSPSNACITVPVSGVTVIPTTGLRGAMAIGGIASFSDNKMDANSSFVSKGSISNLIQYAPPSPYNTSNAVHNANNTSLTASSDSSSTTAAEQLQILAFHQPVSNELLSWSHQQPHQNQQQPYVNQQVFQDQPSHNSQSEGYLMPQTTTSSNANCSPIHMSGSQQHSDNNMLNINDRQILRMTLSQVNIDEQNSQIVRNHAGSLQTTNHLLQTDLIMPTHQQLSQMQPLPVSLSQQSQTASQPQQRSWIGQMPYHVPPPTTFTPEPKPAECPLCHRKFKNVPALNGHMRLHGGYFKRDSEGSKKSEKKMENASNNPPLTTASMNIRALIEEKIIQKRITNPQVYQIGNYSELDNGQNQFQVVPTVDETSISESLPMDLNESLSLNIHEDLMMNIREELLSQQPLPPEKFRRHSDSDHFLAPKRPPASSALVEILRRKVAGKRAQRTGSDPGESFIPSLIHNPSLPHGPSTMHSPLHSPLLQPTTPVSIPNSPTTPTSTHWPQNRPMDFMFASEMVLQNPPDNDNSVPPSETHTLFSIPSSTSATTMVPKIHLEREDDDDVFLNPSVIPASPMRTKKKHRPEPLFIPPHVNTSMSRFPSQLRSPRLWDPNSEGKSGSPPPYTPPPMLSPVRNGSGLFWHILSSGSATPKSAPITPRFGITHRGNSIEGVFTVEDDEITEPPESDVQPHVNIGPQYQAVLPICKGKSMDRFYEQDKADLVWDPKVETNISEEEVEAYLEFACCAAIPGGGRNKEYALIVLHMANGNLQDALLRLMDPSPKLPKGHHLLTYPFTECDRWTLEDIDGYTQALNKCDKDFFSIAQELNNKTVKQCVQFYYLWKKVCPDEYKRHRIIRRKREQENLIYNLRSKGASDEEIDESQIESKYDAESPVSFTGRDSPATGDKFSCEYPDCSATFISRQALNGHVRIHGGNTTTGGKQQNGPNCSPPDGVDVMKNTYSPMTNSTTSTTSTEVLGEFPCKVCGKVFPKVKSRSAHMKSHRQIDPDKRSSKYD
uniref:Transcriptional-regulating factor 1 n=1 Tax=Strigamia maritima TaxID=126957 RepID=T1IPX5_STRMM